MREDTINNSPDSEKSDHSKSWFSEIVKFLKKKQILKNHLQMKLQIKHQLH